jgi:hypothetical protein
VSPDDQVTIAQPLRPERRVLARSRVVQVDMTRTMFVRLPAEEAEAALDKDADYTDMAERLTEWERIAHYDAHHYDGGFEITDAEEYRLTDWLAPEPVDAVDGRPSFLWSARHFVERARGELNCGRYREGHCPELDEVNTLLGRLEERLRLMALAVDGTPA